MNKAFYEECLFLEDNYDIIVLTEGIMDRFKKDKSMQKDVKEAEREFEENKKILRKYGIDPKDIKNDVKNNIRSIKNDVKNGKKTSDVVKDLIKKYTAFDKFDVEGANNVIYLTVITIVVQVFIYELLAVFFSEVVAMIILGAIIGPITEEFEKFLAINDDLGAENAFVFNATEFTLYIVQLTSLGINLPTAIVSRIPAVIMHYVTSMITDHYVNDDTKNGKTGLVISTIVHMVFNALAIIAGLKYANSGR